MTLGDRAAARRRHPHRRVDARFAQIEIKRGIYPFGGATIRLPRDAGWGNAMRWLLTGEEYDAAEAHRIGLVQEVVEPGRQLERAVELAEAIATRSAPLRRQATLASPRSARSAEGDGRRGPPRADMAELFETEDGARGCSRSSSAARRSSRADESPPTPTTTEDRHAADRCLLPRRSPLG